MGIANFAAASTLVFTALFVWSTLRLDLQQPTFIQRQKPRVGVSPVHKPQRPASFKPTTPIEDAFFEDAEMSTTKTPSSAFAYAFYATSDEYACSALVNIYRLQHVLDAHCAIHVLLSTTVSDRYVAAFQEANAHVHLERPPPLASANGGYYQDCLLKLLAFKLHQLSPGLERVLAFDADQLIMRNLDDMFTGLPHVDLAAPRAYWLAKDFLASTFMMIDLSDRLWQSVRGAFGSVGNEKFEMDIVNDLLGDEVMMLSGEYVTLNSHFEDWNLPKWYHPTTTLNMTTVNRLNELAQQARIGGMDKRQETELASAIVNATNASTSTSSQTYDTSTSSTTVVSPPTPVVVKPRFPENHPISKELFELEKAAAIIHFSAFGKPWTVTDEMLRAQRPDAHPLLGEQFRLWRTTAAMVCPGMAEALE